MVLTSCYFCWPALSDSSWTCARLYTRTMHAYDALYRAMRQCVYVHCRCGWAAWSRCAAGLVGAQRTVRNNCTWKSELRSCESARIHAFLLFSTSCSLLALLASMVDWLLCFFPRVASCQLRSAFISALDSAVYVCCEGLAALSSLSSITKTLSKFDVALIFYSFISFWTALSECAQRACRLVWFLSILHVFSYLACMLSGEALNWIRV